MNVPTIAMDQKTAKKAYADYHRLVLERRAERRAEIRRKGHELGRTVRMLKADRSRLEREDEELMTAYKALAHGQQIINLPQVIRAAGVQEKTSLPALAIGRATWKDCFFQIQNGRGLYSEESFVRYREDRDSSTKVVRLAGSVFPAETTDLAWRQTNGLPRYPVKALVPSIPPHLRPSKLENYFILWDAVWRQSPPVDPLLLKRLSRDIFAIVAQWDLTPLERSILEGRIGN